MKDKPLKPLKENAGEKSSTAAAVGPEKRDSFDSPVEICSETYSVLRDRDISREERKETRGSSGAAGELSVAEEASLRYGARTTDACILLLPNSEAVDHLWCGRPGKPRSLGERFSRQLRKLRSLPTPSSGSWFKKQEPRASF
jgi:hypothetical protein